METWRIVWETDDGRFGWTTIEGCLDMEDALREFDRIRLPGQSIDTVRKMEH